MWSEHKKFVGPRWDRLKEAMDYWGKAPVDQCSKCGGTGCGYVSSTMSDLYPIHGGCLDGSEAVPCPACNPDIDLSKYKCEFCGHHGVTDWRDGDVKYRRCHCCSRLQLTSQVDEPMIAGG